jgi:hypothetical protein
MDATLWKVGIDMNRATREIRGADVLAERFRGKQ